MDLSSFGHKSVSAVSEDQIEPGRYVLEYISDEAKQVGSNGGVKCECLFKVVDTSHFVRHGFWVEHNNPKAVEIGLQGLGRLAGACGMKDLSNTDVLVGKRVSAEVVINDNGYAEIKDDVGKTFQPVSETKEEAKAEKKEEVKDDPKTEEDIPF